MNHPDEEPSGLSTKNRVCLIARKNQLTVRTRLQPGLTVREIIQNEMEGDRVMRDNIMDSYFYALVKVIDAIYREEEELSDLLYFIVSLAAELTGGKGSTIRVLEYGTLDLKLISSYGLSEEYLGSGAIDHGRSVTEIMQGDVIIINDFEHDPRVQNLEAAKKEGLFSVIGVPLTVSETTYSILRVYYASNKVPTHEEMELLYSLGKLACLAIVHDAIQRYKEN